MNVFQAYDFDWLMQKLETDQVTADRLLQTLESFNHHEVYRVHDLGRSCIGQLVKQLLSSNIVPTSTINSNQWLP